MIFYYYSIRKNHYAHHLKIRLGVILNKKPVVKFFLGVNHQHVSEPSNTIF